MATPPLEHTAANSRAVFLSYASQDAGAAKRICDALRAAGVEVWFDQSELVGGDAWDQKIRRQIKECALLIPIVSAATQARTEGYFRLEWRLADQRTHLMAMGRPFLLPVVIDATRDSEAHVPDSFTEVQWTKLPDGETTPAFCARVQQLLSLESEGGRGRRTPPSGDATGNGGVGDPALQKKSSPAWLHYAWAGVGIVFALVYTLRPLWQPARVKEAKSPAAASAPAPLTETQKLVAQAREVINQGSHTTKWQTAALLCERALVLGPTDADALGLASQVDTRLWFHVFDRTDQRSESARSRAARALNLAPTSFEARLAQATYLVYVAGRPQSDQAESVLRALRQENPQDPRAVIAQARLLMDQERYSEVFPLYDEAAQLPGFGPNALTSKAWDLHRLRRIEEMDVALDRSMAGGPIGGAVTLRVFYDLAWLGDVDRALANLKKLPAEELAEDIGISAAVRVYRWRRDAAGLLRFLGTVPREWIHWGIHSPKAALTGDAYAALGRMSAARTDWQSALALVDRQLAVTPNDGILLEGKAYLQAALGEEEKARETYARSREAPAPERGLLEVEKFGRIAPPDEVLAELEHRVEGTISALDQHQQISVRFIAAADLRLNPAWDSVRDLPRFQALQARLDADPRFNPKAKPAAASAPAKVDDKSVAVLAFANLSDDKANEYFSDGISEELLNVLAKIPDLKVSARTSSFYFKGKQVPVPEIAKQLGVAYVVEGSVRKSGARVRITAQLIKAADGFHVWSDTFTRDLKDIFVVQDEIAGLIAQNLQLKMRVSPPEARRTIDPAVYQEYLIGRALVAAGSTASARDGIVHLREALRLDPSLTAAWVQIARTYVHLSRWGGLLTTEEWAEAHRAIERAVALEPDSPDVWLALGWMRRTADWNWRGAEQALREALRLRPDHAETLAALGIMLANLSHEQEAVATAQRAAELDPLNAATQMDLLSIFYVNGRYQEAERAGRRAIELLPGGQIVHSWLALSLVEQHRFPEAEAEARLEPEPFARQGAQIMCAIKQGRTAEARALLEDFEVKAKAVGGAANSYAYLALLWGHLGEQDKGFAAIQKTRDIRDPSIAWVRTRFFSTGLGTHPRWPEFLRSVGLADEKLK